MTRKEMIEEIAKQAECSKRLVRKKLFQLSSRFKKDARRKNVLFNQAFLCHSTDWKDGNEMMKEWIKDRSGENPFKISNQFEVIYFPTGCNVLFKVDEVDENGELWKALGSCGVRLYNY